jgi:uncharacterized membrane protein HdeD (DUF308 family)
MTTIEQRRPAVAGTLRNLYFVRFGFAIVWAVLIFAFGRTLGAASIILLVLYPLFDLAAAVVDHRSSRANRPARALYVNMALSLLTAIGLAIAVTSGLPAVLAVWGAWAITAGAVQLILAILRRSLGGQWPMILSGAISVIAGTAFIVQSGTASASLASLAGYATLGGIFFLISAIRLSSAAKSTI